MELDKVIEIRRSIRKFKQDPVPDETINKILEAARLAPSGSNIQPWRFIIAKSDQEKEKLRSVTPFRFALKAPVLIVCCADMTALEKRDDRVNELFQAGVFNDVEMDGLYAVPERTKEQALSYLAMNVGIAITYIMLKASDLGLGTCWIGGFDPKKTKEILNLDENLYVIALLPIGYYDRLPSQRPRFSLDKLILKTT